MARLTRVLIAGCGDVGSELGRLLAADGVEVFGLRRDASAIEPPIRPIAADLGDPKTLRALPDGIDAVVYAAAAGASDEDAYRCTYVDGPRNLLEALRDRPPGRLLFSSSTAVYGQDDGSWVDETSETEPDGFRGRLLLEGERTAGGIAVRFGGIYGPGRRYLVDAVRSGRVGLSPDGDSRHTNRIHRDDAARVLAYLLVHPDPADVYVAVDEEPAPMDDVVRFIAARLRVEPRVVAGRSRAGDKRCSSARLRATGFRFRFPTYREGYAALLTTP